MQEPPNNWMNLTRPAQATEPRRLSRCCADADADAVRDECLGGFTVAEYPHRGPNISKFTLEGVGGFIYALTPVLILLFTAPWLLFIWVVVGAAVAPLIYWRTHSARLAATHLAGGASGFLVTFALLTLVGDNPLFRLLAGGCVAAGLAMAMWLNWRHTTSTHPSIRFPH